MLQFIIRFCVVSITFATLSHVQQFCIWSSAKEQNPECSSTECYKLTVLNTGPQRVEEILQVEFILKSYENAGRYIQNNMNPNANPCNDFYDYVCGNWRTNHPRPEHEDMWNLERFMEHRVYEELRKMLQDEKPKKVKDIGDAKALYRACLSLPFMGKFGPKALKSIMSKVGNWPMFFPMNKTLPVDLPWWKIDNEYQSKTGESALYTVILLTNLKTKKIMPQVQRLMTPYGLMTRTAPWSSAKEKNHYKGYLRKIIKSVAPTSPIFLKGQIERDLTDVLNFRDALQLTIVLKENEKFDIMSLAQFNSWYKSKATSESAEINWPETIRSLIRQPATFNINSVDEMSFLVHQTYFAKLANLLSETPKRVIVNHIHLYFAEKHLDLTPEMETDLEESVSEHTVPTGDIKSAIPRWIWCIVTNNMKDGLKKAYVKEFFPSSSKSAVETLVLKTKFLLQGLIADSNWLDPVSKRAAMAKVGNIASVIGYPNESNKRLSSGHGGWEIDPLEGDAFFEQGLNRLSISAAYLQLPVYSPNLPYVIDYGSTIAMLGHEFHHAFDRKGLLYGPNGNTPWLPLAVYTKFLHQTQCFDNHFTRYKDDKLREFKLNVLTQTLPDTVDEDLADIMGMKLAYKGFKDKIKISNGLCPVLPGFRNLGCDKLFFIAFGNAFCSDLTSGTQRTILLGDHHSLPAIRLNGAVANSKAFSTVFGCKPNDRLYAKKTCNLWKK